MVPGVVYNTPTMYVYVNYKIVYYTHTPLRVISAGFEKHCISIGRTPNSMCKYSDFDIFFLVRFIFLGLKFSHKVIKLLIIVYSMQI